MSSWLMGWKRGPVAVLADSERGRESSRDLWVCEIAVHDRANIVESYFSPRKKTITTVFRGRLVSRGQCRFGAHIKTALLRFFRNQLSCDFIKVSKRDFLCPAVRCNSALLHIGNELRWRRHSRVFRGAR